MTLLSIYNEFVECGFEPSGGFSRGHQSWVLNGEVISSEDAKMFLMQQVLNQFPVHSQVLKQRTEELIAKGAEHPDAQALLELAFGERQ